MKWGDYTVQSTNNLSCLGGMVKSARQAKELTQSQLAERLLISTRYLKAIENSGRKPSYDLLARIIIELDIPANMVFPLEQKERNTGSNIILWPKAT